LAENMNEGLINRILDPIRSAGGDLLPYGIAAVIAILVLVIVWRIVARRRRELPPPAPDLAVDVNSLGTEGPPAAGPTLEHYNVPVRLAAVVLAPTGRGRELPSVDQLPPLIDHIVPGLAQVVAAHRPLIRRWPAQLSAEGFAHTFFAQVRLPGDRGKGTPWCSVAGRFAVGRRPLMAGLVMRAAAANNFSQSIVQREHEWLGILRVKSG
jgi:hypothetical protein